MSRATRIDHTSTRAGMSTYRVRLDGGNEGQVVHYQPRALREGIAHCTTCKTEHCPHADAVRHAVLLANHG